MKKIKRILIANRGEVARRIFKSANDLNIEVVYLYSKPEANAPYLSEAFKAIMLKGETLAESFLNQKEIIRIAKENKCDAIHPGYGFLSENHEFAKKVRAAGIIFIGPSTKAIKLMGSKARAKELVKNSGVPLIEGFNTSDCKSEEEILKRASKIEFPLLIKASAGGGGKGMRIVYKKEDLKNEYAQAKSEAKQSFGNSELIIEKFLENPKHIEVQVIGDKHGNVTHCFERHCSAQRRYQKVIEEAPAEFLPNKVREKLYEYSINISKAISYSSLGTMEFLVDSKNKIYFIEMNTRLQVEHVVTEMICNIDLVRAQIEIENGKKLEEALPNISYKGHSIQLRVYAEDPENNFLPASGVINKLILPDNDKKLRVENALYSGVNITNDFDPMLFKLVSFGKNRDSAIKELNLALNKTRVLGIKQNLGFLKRCLNTKLFKAKSYSTSFIPATENERKKLKESDLELKVALALASMHYFKVNNFTLSGFRNSGPSSKVIKLEYSGENYIVKEVSLSNTKKEYFVNSEKAKLVKRKIGFNQVGDSLYIFGEFSEFKFSIVKELSFSSATNQESDLSAPMNATVSKVLVKKNQKVSANQVLVVLEAMKMEMQIKATKDGVVKTVYFVAGNQVSQGEPLLEVDYE